MTPARVIIQTKRRPLVVGSPREILQQRQIRLTTAITASRNNQLFSDPSYVQMVTNPTQQRQIRLTTAVTASRNNQLFSDPSYEQTTINPTLFNKKNIPVFPSNLSLITVPSMKK